MEVNIICYTGRIPNGYSAPSAPRPTPFGPTPWQRQFALTTVVLQTFEIPINHLKFSNYITISIAMNNAYIRLQNEHIENTEKLLQKLY